MLSEGAWAVATPQPTKSAAAIRAALRPRHRVVCNCKLTFFIVKTESEVCGQSYE